MPAPNEPQVRFKGNLFARPDYFTTDVMLGATRTPSGSRVCALTSDFLLGFRDAVIYECGDAYRSVMKNCGRRWGKEFARRFDKEMAGFYQSAVKDLAAGVVHACLADAFAAHGWGTLSIDLSECEVGVLQATISNSVMPALVMESDRPSDHLMCGLLASLFTHFSGTELDAVQTECASCGASASRFLVGSPTRIAALAEWLETQEKSPSHEVALNRLLGNSPRKTEHHHHNGVPTTTH